MPLKILRRSRTKAALEGDDHHPGVTKDAVDLGQGNAAGEAVQVMEQLEFRHRESVTSFSSEERSHFPRKSVEFNSFTTENHPPKNRKSLFSFVNSVSLWFIVFVLL